MKALEDCSNHWACLSTSRRIRSRASRYSLTKTGRPPVKSQRPDSLIASKASLPRPLRCRIRSVSSTAFLSCEMV